MVTWFKEPPDLQLEDIFQKFPFRFPVPNNPGPEQQGQNPLVPNNPGTELQGQNTQQLCTVCSLNGIDSIL